MQIAASNHRATIDLGNRKVAELISASSMHAAYTRAFPELGQFRISANLPALTNVLTLPVDNLIHIAVRYLVNNSLAGYKPKIAEHACGMSHTYVGTSTRPSDQRRQIQPPIQSRALQAIWGEKIEMLACDYEQTTQPYFNSCVSVQDGFLVRTTHPTVLPSSPQAPAIFTHRPYLDPEFEMKAYALKVHGSVDIEKTHEFLQGSDLIFVRHFQSASGVSSYPAIVETLVKSLSARGLVIFAYDQGGGRAQNSITIASKRAKVSNFDQTQLSDERGLFQVLFQHLM